MDAVICREQLNYYGLFEIERNGKIIYTRYRKNNQLISMKPHFVGLNFFEDIADFKNVGELKRHFDIFFMSNQISNNFIFDCRFDEETVPIRIMMLKAYSDSCLTPSNIVILDIREYLTH